MILHSKVVLCELNMEQLGDTLSIEIMSHWTRIMVWVFAIYGLVGSYGY